MSRPLRILLQTTIPAVEDDWHVGRFSLLRAHLESLRDEGGRALCEVGRAHFFHSRHQDPDESRRARDDRGTESISWPNYHSGSNGDYQRVTPAGPPHELLRGTRSSSGLVEYFPAHPHEG